MLSSELSKIASSSQIQPRLLQIPLEIRLQILKYVLVRHEPIRDVFEGNDKITNIFETCQQLYIEASEVFFAENVFGICVEDFWGSLLVYVANKEFAFGQLTTAVAGRAMIFDPLERYFEVDLGFPSHQTSIVTQLQNLERAQSFAVTFGMEGFESISQRRRMFLACHALSSLLHGKHVEVVLNVGMYEYCDNDKLQRMLTDQDEKQAVLQQARASLSVLRILRCRSMRIRLKVTHTQKQESLFRVQEQELNRNLHDDIAATRFVVEGSTPCLDLVEKWSKFLQQPSATYPTFNLHMADSQFSRTQHATIYGTIYVALVKSDEVKFDVAVQRLKGIFEAWCQQQLECDNT